MHISNSSSRLYRAHTCSGTSRLPLVITAAVTFVAGAVLASLLTTKWKPATVAHPEQRLLTDSTMSVLENLSAAVELRFYALLDPAVAPKPLVAFAGRAEELVSKYEQAAPGRITLKRVTTRSDETANAASADGIKPFNMELGAASFLGLTVAGKQRKEVLPRLEPEWEQALEADITRAIARASVSGAPVPTDSAAPPIDMRALEQLRRDAPEVVSLPLEEGKKLLRERALSTFSAEVKAMQSQLAEAQKKVLDAQQRGDAAEQQAAVEEMQKLQAEQSRKMRELAARHEAQQSALEQLKRQ